MCYRAERGRSALKCVSIDRGEPQNWGILGLRPSLGWVMAHPIKTNPLPMCYHVKFGRSASNGVHKIEGNPKNGSAVARPLAVGAWLIP